MTELPRASVLVRTWFGDDGAWDAFLEVARTPNEDEFLADVIPVNDREFDGLTAEGLQERQPGGALVSFLVDETTLTGPGHPVLAVWVYRRDGDLPDPEPFRVVAAELWSVANNINLGNMDWVDFTRSTDADGVFRGF